jgi:hypothetical protein
MQTKKELPHVPNVMTDIISKTVSAFSVEMPSTTAICALTKIPARIVPARSSSSKMGNALNVVRLIKNVPPVTGRMLA